MLGGDGLFLHFILLPFLTSSSPLRRPRRRIQPPRRPCGISNAATVTHCLLRSPSVISRQHQSQKRRAHNFDHGARHLSLGKDRSGSRVLLYVCVCVCVCMYMRPPPPSIWLPALSYCVPAIFPPDQRSVAASQPPLARPSQLLFYLLPTFVSLIDLSSVSFHFSRVRCVSRHSEKDERKTHIHTHANRGLRLTLTKFSVDRPSVSLALYECLNFEYVAICWLG